MNTGPTEIVRRSKALYEQQIRAKLEDGSRGKVLVINVETGEYEMDADHLAASNRAAAKFPGVPRYAMRIGARALGRIGSRSPIGAKS